ncbi:MAG: endonuclease/exonuclease/phosphatase family protein [Rhodothermales bacterium]|nr:endonuclease/exonuclease/phosphatase family protein [Rhodothermales bacterium]
MSSNPSAHRFRWWAFYLLHIVVLGVFVGGYAARYIHPETFWWLQLIAVGLPYLCLALIPFALLVVYARAWRLLAVYVIALGLVLVRFSPFVGGASDPGEGLRLLSFNIGHLESYTAVQSPDVLAEVVQQMESDLYVFQDLLIRYRRREQRIVNFQGLEKKLGAAGVVVHAEEGPRIETTFQPVWARTGQVILLEERRIKMATDDSLSMGVTRYRFSWQGREAVLYNVHLRTFGERKPWSDAERRLLSLDFWRSYLGQYRQAFLLRAVESESIRALMDQETLPLIVSGDFNSTVHNWSYAHLAAGMQDAFSEVGKGFGFTYHTRYPFVRIDHVLVSPAWEIRSAEVILATYSDHRPLRVVLGWRP